MSCLSAEEKERVAAEVVNLEEWIRLSLDVFRSQTGYCVSAIEIENLPGCGDGVATTAVRVGGLKRTDSVWQERLEGIPSEAQSA